MKNGASYQTTTLRGIKMWQIIISERVLKEVPRKKTSLAESHA